MHPLRLSLFALLLLAVLGLSQETEAAAPTIELLTPHEGSYVPFDDWDNEDIYFTWNSTDSDDDALVHKIYFGTDKDDLDQIGSTTDEVLKYTTDISYNTTYYWKASANDGGGEVFLILGILQFSKMVQEYFGKISEMVNLIMFR